MDKHLLTVFCYKNIFEMHIVYFNLLILILITVTYNFNRTTLFLKDTNKANLIKIQTTNKSV